MSDVLVIGGGVIGASIAWRLAQRGANVAVVDPGNTAGAATPAAGGMLSPLAEAHGPGAFLELGLESFRRYAGFVDELEDATGRDVAFEPAGKLMLALDDEAEATLEQGFEWPIRAGHAVERIDAAQARALEPAVAPDIRSAVLIRDDARVDNVLLFDAVLTAASATGVHFVQARVTGLLHGQGGAIAGATLDDGSTIEAATVVLAAGCWSAGIEGLPRPLPVEPVRGQMLALRPDHRLFQRTLATPGGYLVPRPDGRVIIGSTMEKAGFEPTTTAAGLSRLRALAARAVPGLRDLVEVDSWAGLRPGTGDGLPILGPDPVAPGLVYATAHLRNGILLAPVTADAIAALVDGTEPPVGLRPFAVDRLRQQPGGQARDAPENGDSVAAHTTGGGSPEADASRGRQRQGAGPPGAGSADAASRSDPACDVCGSPMYEVHCKLICPTCGYKRDCSDP